MGEKFNKSAYDLAYNKANMVQKCLRLHKVHDADVIQRLDKVPNVNGYIKDLIRNDIAKDAEREREQK